MPGLSGLLMRLNPLHFLKQPNELEGVASRMGQAAVKPPASGIGSIMPPGAPLPNVKPSGIGVIPTPLPEATRPDFSGLPRTPGGTPGVIASPLPASTAPIVARTNRGLSGGNTPMDRARDEYVAERPPAPGLRGRLIEALKSAGTGFLQGAATNPENPLGAGIGGAIAGGIGGAAHPGAAAEYRFNVFEKPRLESEENRALQMGMERAKLDSLASRTAHDAAMIEMQRQQQAAMQENLKRDNERADWQTFEISDPATGVPFTVRYNARTGERQIIGRSGRLINQQIISGETNQTRRDVASASNQTRRDVADKLETGRNNRAAATNSLRRQAMAGKQSGNRPVSGGTSSGKVITEAEIRRQYGARADQARQMLKSQGYTIQ